MELLFVERITRRRLVLNNGFVAEYFEHRLRQAFTRFPILVVIQFMDVIVRAAALLEDRLCLRVRLEIGAVVFVA